LFDLDASFDGINNTYVCVLLQGPLSAEEEARMKEQAEADAKRQKRLALNRKAAHESRKRKKVKFATLTKYVAVAAHASARLDLHDAAP
jgi:hypothetical protein